MFVDIAPDNDELLALAQVAEQVVVLDHHVTARDRYEADPGLSNRIEELGHEICFDLTRSGAVLAWTYFSRDPVPPLLEYVQDQDLWQWKLPDSREVNATIGAHPLSFDTWDELTARSVRSLADEGRPIVRSERVEIERRARAAHAIELEGRLVAAVNSTTVRSSIGHVLAERKAYGIEWGCVYRIDADRVHATLYSIGDVDVATVAGRYGGGGHRNAAGFSVPLARWLSEMVEPARGR